MMDDKAFIENIKQVLQDAILNIKPETVLSYKRMFGGAGYYADGQIFAAWFRNDTIALKLSDEDGASLLQIDGAEKGMMGKYIDVPAAWLNDPDELAL
jgi:TfoX/Sxy family transcriptional regulator of competence genes